MAFASVSLEIPQQQRELVAAEPADDIGGAHLRGEHGNDRLQHLIARGVSEGIVDRLQPVDVEHDQRAGGAIALDVGQRAGELALEAAPVGNAEQKVGIGGGLQLLDFPERPRQLACEAAGSSFSLPRPPALARARRVRPVCVTCALRAGVRFFMGIYGSTRIS